ncbi:hypothetical protein [Methylobacterium sp. E-016]|nr:hypothetical protein [Methylobacterium sp. E-016]
MGMLTRTEDPHTLLALVVAHLDDVDISASGKPRGLTARDVIVKL